MNRHGRIRRKAAATRSVELSHHVTPRHAGRYTFRMRIYLNGQSHECATNVSVASLLAEAGYADRRVAVEVNREIVPRSRHAQHALHEDDRVEIVQAIGGG